MKSEADDELILEGIVTTRDVEGGVNVSPMGPRVDRQLTRMVLRPYQTSRTYRNLKEHRKGVFHVTDDVEVIARCAIGRHRPSLVEVDDAGLPRLADCCRWFAFKVIHLDDSEPRTTITCEMIDGGHVRDFFGFNRAKHAVLEAAILATRVSLLEPGYIRSELARLEPLITKTAGEQERSAFALVATHIDSELARLEDPLGSNGGI